MIKRDENCGHDAKFRDQTPDAKYEYCVKCACDRWEAAWRELIEDRKAYEALREYMDNESAPDTKVVLWFPHNGYEHDQKQIKEMGMKLGQVFTIDHTDVGGSHTAVYLKEFPGKIFNSVNFGVPSKADLICPVL